MLIIDIQTFDVTQNKLLFKEPNTPKPYPNRVHIGI